jgi:hypothetical protein
VILRFCPIDYVIIVVCSNAAIQEVMAEGHVLVAVNNRYVVNEEFEDVISFLTMLRYAKVHCVMLGVTVLYMFDQSKWDVKENEISGPFQVPSGRV